jgi:CRP/FNR family transcriptional regulator
MSDLNLLQKAGVFRGLPDADLALIAQKAAFMKMDKGSYIFYRGDPSDGVYFVAAGSVQIIIDSDDNREIIVYSVEEGDILGELSIFENHRRSATAVVLTDARLFKIANDRFVEILHRLPSVAVNLSRALVNRLLAANVMIERMGAMDGTERMADFVRTLAAREGTLRDGQYILPRPPCNQISHRLGVSEKTVYRTMRQMASDGKITIRGRELIVPKSFVDSGG